MNKLPFQILAGRTRESIHRSVCTLLFQREEGGGKKNKNQRAHHRPGNSFLSLLTLYCVEQGSMVFFMQTQS